MGRVSISSEWVKCNAQVEYGATLSDPRVCYLWGVGVDGQLQEYLRLSWTFDMFGSALWRCLVLFAPTDGWHRRPGSQVNSLHSCPGENAHVPFVSVCASTPARVPRGCRIDRELRGSGAVVNKLAPLQPTLLAWFVSSAALTYQLINKRKLDQTSSGGPRLRTYPSSKLESDFPP